MGGADVSTTGAQPLSRDNSPTGDLAATRSTSTSYAVHASYAADLVKIIFDDGEIVFLTPCETNGLKPGDPANGS
jgi:hypothetical protein